ncbi:MAG TPA: MFS transporter [Aliidongia sp.]|nr:MFS transporter [Aliidongia sp.]
MTPVPGAGRNDPAGSPAGKAPSALALYAQPRLLAVLVMGFASGLPFALTASTLSIRLAQSGLGFGAIGLFGFVGLSYSLKFLWAPLLDRVSLPLLTGRLGRRRSWLIAIDIALIAAILGLGLSDPAIDLRLTALWAVAVAFLSATQDIVIDAYRVELLSDAEQGAGAAATQFGYRIGLLASGAGALYLAAGWSWGAAHFAMATLMLLGPIAALATPEPQAVPVVRSADWLDATLLAPFRDFLRHRDWVAILLFVLLYRLGSAVADHMAPPFYISLGFSSVEYASISKLFGVAASLAGVSLGGFLVYRFGTMAALFLGGVLQIVSDLTYIAQYWAGHDIRVLTATIGVESISAGIYGAAFVAYLSGLCNRAHTATQYALLTALAGLTYRIFGSTGGLIVDRIGWVPFFGLSAALVLPALFLLGWLMRNQVKG